MGFIRWQEGHPLAGVIDFGFSLLNIALLYYLRYRKYATIDSVITLALTSSFVIFFAIFVTAPYNVTRLSLFFLLLVSVFFLKGRKAGFLWLIIILASLVAVQLIPHFETDYSGIDIFTTSLYLIALFFIFETYEKIKEEQRRRVEQLNRHLEEQVQ